MLCATTFDGAQLPSVAVPHPRQCSKSSTYSNVLCSASPTGSAQGGSVETRMARRWSSAHAERRYCPGGSSSGRGTSSDLHARTQPTTHQPYHVATAVCCGVCRHCDNDNLQHLSIICGQVHRYPMPSGAWCSETWSWPKRTSTEKPLSRLCTTRKADMVVLSLCHNVVHDVANGRIRDGLQIDPDPGGK